MLRSTRSRVVLVVVVLVVALVAFGLWWYLRDDAPPEAGLVDRPTGTTAPVEGGDAGPTADSADGTWTVAVGEETFAGLRIDEQFPGVDHTAVMRTPGVEGSLTVAGSQVTAAEVTADLTQLESQDTTPPGVPGVGNRANAIRDDGLETNSFPTATFRLTQPISLPSAPVIGEAVEAQATGDLTIHGVTRNVTIPIQARWSGDVIDIAGSLEVVLADYGMTPPSRQFVSVADAGTMELQLAFTRS
jgi:polyisoprenoid-binding protein YceI